MHSSASPSRAGLARAHSLAELDQQLDARERRVQALDHPAPAFQLQEAEGHPVLLDGLAGKVVAVNFFYTHCPDVCPLHAEKIAAVQQLVNQSAMRDRARFVTIATDPVRDTSAVLRQYHSQHGLDPANWLFLTSSPGRPEARRRLAEAFGHRFDETPDGLQMHGVVIHIVGREGWQRGNFHGFDFGNLNFVLFVEALANGDYSSSTSEDGIPANVSRTTKLRNTVEGR